jgi:hypothetical protein
MDAREIVRQTLEHAQCVCGRANLAGGANLFPITSTYQPPEHENVDLIKWKNELLSQFEAGPGIPDSQNQAYSARKQKLIKAAQEANHIADEVFPSNNDGRVAERVALLVELFKELSK